MHTNSGAVTFQSGTVRLRASFIGNDTEIYHIFKNKAGLGAEIGPQERTISVLRNSKKLNSVE